MARYRQRGVFSHSGSARIPRHYSKFLPDSAQLGLWIVGAIAAFLLFVVFLAFSR